MARNRIEEGKETIEMMVRIFCKWNMEGDGICSGCQDLLEYARERLDRCPFGEHKPSCRKCRIHCYKPSMRKRMQEVMRFAGPRMLLYHPVVAIKHIIQECKTPPVL
ncbi:MAG: nitrous oxide-stimulated promoter family protein [Bacteroidales bacterium]